MMTNKVKICGVNTSKLPVLKESENKMLLLLIKDGDEKSRQKLINCNLKLILSVIHKFGNRGEYVDDLFQIGCIGLIKAIDNFDLSHNVRFSTYAVPMIYGEIRRYLRDNRSIKVSRSLKDIAYNALQIRDKLIKENEKEPTISQIAKELMIPKEELVFALDAIQDPVSLNEPIYHDGGNSTYVMDQVKDMKNNDEIWLKNISIKEGIKKLNKREKLILNLRYFVGRTQM